MFPTARPPGFAVASPSPLMTSSAGPASRQVSPRRYLMCPPEHFDVTYAINPWMDPDRPVDRGLVLDQWQQLVTTYRQLGHEVAVLPPAPGLPDMVFAANGGLVVDGRAMGARFRHHERAAEAEHYLAWFRRYLDPAAVAPVHVLEAEGDVLQVGEVLLAGYGFRTDRAAHVEVAAWSGREVVSLELVDPRYYHLDTCLGVLDEQTLAWLPSAFAPEAQAELRRRYPDAIEVDADEAALLAINLVSDGRHVIVPPGATRFRAALEAADFVPIAVDLSELRKAGGGAKCATLELRSAA